MNEMSVGLRILYLEDNPVDAELTGRALARLAPDYRLELVGSLAAALQRLEPPDPPYDVVLADLRLPDGNGLEVLGHVRSRNLPLAVVLLTGSGSRDAAIAALRAGADDYLLKERDYLERLPTVLVAALDHYRENAARWQRALRLLYAEPNPADIALVRRHLEAHAPHIAMDTVADGRELLARLTGDCQTAPPYDLLLLNFQLPDFTIPEILKTLRDALGKSLPVVLIGERGSEEEVAEALHLGVTDYLIKQPGYLFGLPATLEQAVRLDQLLREQAALRASEQRFRQLEERFRVIFEGAIDGILLVDPETRKFILANPAICLMLGYPPEELTALRVDDIHPAAELAGVLACFERCLRNEECLAQEVPVLRRDGSVFYVDISASFVHLEGKAYLMGVFRDISKQRETGALLLLHAAALQASRDGMVITDLAGNIISVNQAFSEITGYGEEEVVGKNPRLLKSQRHDRSFYQAMWARIKEQGYWQGDIWDRRKNGEICPVLLSISTVYDEHKRPSHYVGVLTDLTNLRRSEEQLQHLAHHDPLTGLPNRLLLEARLEHGLQRARRERTRVAVLVINLDRFRAVNESMGYAVGDQLLVAAIDRLRERLRGEDTLARLAGDEFALVLEAINDHQEAEAVARWVREALAPPFALPDGGEIYLQASIGIGIYPQDGETMLELLAGADAAVNQAKGAGGNQFSYANPAFNSQARRNLELEAALRRALEQREFLLYYQPKVDLQSGQVVGAEALIRWQLPGQGLIAPGEFIPVAERSGLIVEIGAWVIDEACRQLAAWSEEGLGNIRLAANASARQFNSDGLVGVLERALAEHRVVPELFTLELTESMLMLKPEEAIGRMEALKRLGIKLSLDDFGTGYSSFASLSRFPIDQLKIDRSFIVELIDSPNAATIAVSIIAMAHRMRLQVVAEGVESEAQCSYLRRNGCDQMQGFLFSKPLPAAEFAQLLAQHKMLEIPVEPSELRTLLIVDDEPHVLAALRRLLDDEGYRVLAAAGAAEGLQLLAENRVEVIISDQRMPKMSGIEFLSRVKDIYPDTVRMVLSGYADLETVVEAVNEGALYKFLAKPWKNKLLLAHIRDAFLYHEAIIKPRYRKDPDAAAEERG